MIDKSGDENLAANILNSAFTPSNASGEDGVALMSAVHPVTEDRLPDSFYTSTTRDIAEHLTRKAMDMLEALAQEDALETKETLTDRLTYLIERELDKYFDEGTLQWTPRD